MNDGNPIAGPDTSGFLAGEMAAAEALAVVDITSPTEFASIAGAIDGDQRRAYQVAAGSDEYTLYRWDSADSGAASSPYRIAGSSGMWRAVGGRYQDGPRFFNGAITIIGALSASGNFAIATNKFTVAAASGNTAIAGTLGVTGATALAALAATTISASGQITSTVVTGTAPLVVASTTVVANLNVSQLLGSTWAIPGAIGSTTPNTGAFSTLSSSGLSTLNSASITTTLGVTGVTTLTGTVSALGLLKVGTQDGGHYVGIARNASGDHYAYINAGIGGDGVTQASTGLKLAVRNSGNSQVIGLALDENGAGTFVSTVTASDTITGTKDGSVASLLGGLVARNASNTNKNIILGVTTGDVYFVQANLNGTGSRPLSIQPGGGNTLIGTSTDDGANLLQIAGNVSIASGSALKINNVQVVAARDTGWTAMTGSPDKATAYATGSVTLAQLAGRVAQIQASLTTHGLLGA